VSPGSKPSSRSGKGGKGGKPGARKPGAQGVSKATGVKKPPSAAKRPPAGRAVTTGPRVSFGWIVGGVVIAAIVVILVAVAVGGGDKGSSGASTGGGSGAATVSPTTAELEANTKAADVPLLDQEGVATHIHTTLIVDVNGEKKVVPAGIGIDVNGGKIAALHTHDASGLIHLESAKANDSFTLEQFLMVWGMPKDAAGQCAFFGAKAPCTLTVTSQDSGTVGLDVPLKDYDTLTLKITST
jgi:hypothetical protein